MFQVDRHIGRHGSDIGSKKIAQNVISMKTLISGNVVTFAAWIYAFRCAVNSEQVDPFLSGCTNLRSFL